MYTLTDAQRQAILAILFRVARILAALIVAIILWGFVSTLTGLQALNLALFYLVVGILMTEWILPFDPKVDG